MSENINVELENTRGRLAIAAAQRKKEKEYWLNKLSGKLEKTIFPYDHKMVGTGEGKLKCEQTLGVEKFRLQGEPFINLMKLSNGSDYLLHIFIVAVLVTLLNKYTRNNDIIVGTTVVKQKQTANDTKLINTILPLRIQLEDRMTFKELLLQVKKTVAEATENRNYPFEILLEQLDLLNGEDESPLFGVGVLVKNIHDKRYFRKIKPDMIFSFLRTRDYGEGEWQYISPMFAKTTIHGIIIHFKTLIREVLFNVEMKLCQINLLSTEEKKQILYEFNHTKKDIKRDKCYHHLFEDQVTRCPDHLGAINNNRQITYNALNEEANQVACFLVQQGVKANDIVALYLKRSLKMLSFILGIFKAGGSYLGLDIDHPEERIVHILEDSVVRILITEKERQEVIEVIRARGRLAHLHTILCLDHGKRSQYLLKHYPVRNPGITVYPFNLAYIIFTSGTTGRPKGVMIHQLGMLNHIYANIDFLSITGHDIMAQTASPCFDISIWQFLTLLILGGVTFIIDKEVIIDPLRLISVLQKGKITILETVPSLLSAFLETIEQNGYHRLEYLRWMIPTGEALGVSLAREWYNYYPHIKLVNAYGPAEASDDISLWIVDETVLEKQNKIFVGKPLQNLHVYIIDPNLLLCPVKLVGEICVAGVGVGKGYLNDPEKTAKFFVPNPYFKEISDDDYSILYKTGDMGYFTQDGNIEFLGRQDHQVKVRGFRIELEEIENQLWQIDGVKGVVVIVREEKTGDKYLCAYIVPHTTTRLSESILREVLSMNLPDYMIPSYFVFLDQIPLNPNGKIDRKALPQPEKKTGDRNIYIAPRNQVETQLVEIWSQILGIEKNIIGVNANFFEFGGHSLKATVMMAKIHKTFNVAVSLAAILKTPTIEEIASLISVIEWAENKEIDANQTMKEVIL
jgi:surfactin family lipopeptide synthetase A/fengycin family lipopeptide synthetase D/tyrocidine synthetase-3